MVQSKLFLVQSLPADFKALFPPSCGFTCALLYLPQDQETLVTVLESVSRLPADSALACLGVARAYMVRRNMRRVPA